MLCYAMLICLHVMLCYAYMLCCSSYIVHFVQTPETAEISQACYAKWARQKNKITKF